MNSPLTNENDLCVCGHELRLHSHETDGTRGLCIKDEWCQCGGYHPNEDYQRVAGEPETAEHRGQSKNPDRRGAAALLVHRQIDGDALSALDVSPPDRHHGGTTIEERDQPPFFDPTRKQP